MSRNGREEMLHRQLQYAARPLTRHALLLSQLDTTFELIHHGAEIALLRDLYRVQSG